MRCVVSALTNFTDLSGQVRTLCTAMRAENDLARRWLFPDLGDSTVQPCPPASAIQWIDQGLNDEQKVLTTRSYVPKS